MDVQLSDFLTIGLLVLLEGLLSADNALVLAILVLGLPRREQRQALHYGIRGALEALAASRAAVRFEADWASPLEVLLDEMAGGPPAARYLELNQRFHTGVYVHSARRQLVEMIAALRDASSAYLHIYRATEDFPVARLDAEHRAILSACVERDPERAAEAARTHLERTVEHVASRLAEPAA